MRLWRSGLALVGLLLPMVSAAQAPEGAERSRPPGQEQPGAVEPGEMRLRAEFQEALGNEHFQFRGFVDLTAGEVRIQADRLDLYVTELPGGGKARKIVAEGNVVFLRGEERLSGERLTMDMDTGKGVFEEALGYVQPGVFVEGRTIERLSADTYRIEGAKFTSCAQPSPRWGFSASSAKVHVDDKIVAHNVLFKVKDVPAFYVPFIMYPIRDDQRSTGLLFPHFGYSSTRGFITGLGFFWAMGRSFDQTFYADRYSKFGAGLGHEFRYALAPESRGSFRSYVFRASPTGVPVPLQTPAEPSEGDSREYELDWDAQQQLPGGFRATVFVHRYSNTVFQQRIQDSLNRASTRSQTSSFNLQGSFGAINVQALVESTETSFGKQTRVDRRLPSVRLNRSPQKLWGTGLVFGFEARGEKLERDFERANRRSLDRYSRFDVNPELSRPISVSFLQVTPRIAGRYTRYGASVTAAGDNGPPLERQYVETRLEVRGPTFYRVFASPMGFYTDKVKHTIGPEVVYRYRTRIDEFRQVPSFDPVDRVVGTHQIEYALVQHFLAKRPGPGGKSAPHEFLSWRVGQTHYLETREGQSELDPNFSSALFALDPQAGRRFSPIQSLLRFRPTQSFSTDFRFDYDVDRDVFQSLILNAGLSGPRGRLQVDWSRTNRLSARKKDAPPPVPQLRETVRVSTRLELLPSRLSVEGSADFVLKQGVVTNPSVVTRNPVHATARLRYDVQCCGFTAEMVQNNYSDPPDRQFRFSIELANIGSIGNFNGEEAGRAGNAGRRVFK